MTTTTPEPIHSDQKMTQEAPYPEILAELVDELTYRPGWTFRLGHIDRGQGSAGLTFRVRTKGYNTYHLDRGQTYCVWHYMPVPPAAYDRRSWQHWLLDQLLLIERHECCEFFQIGGERPFAPNHGPGNDPYIVFDYATHEDRRTSFRGEVNPR